MPAPREDLEKVCGEAKNVKLENDLGRDPIRKLVLNIAIPSMLAQFVSVLYSIVDRIYIGNIPEIGNLALAGAGVCGPVVTMIGSVAFLVGVGGSPLMSIRMGEGNLAQARKILANCFLLLNVLAVLLMAGALLTRRPLLLLFGASETTLPYALFGTVFALLANGMNQFVICQGFAKKGMQSVMLGAVLNIALDPVFIFGLNMGVRGAAIATVISQLGSCLFVLHFLFGPVPQVRITFGGYSRKIISRVLLTGLAPFLIIALDNVMIIALNAVLQNYGGPEQGDMLVAAATIAQSFMLIITMPMAGITGSTGSILGYNFGAGRPDRILEAQKYILALCLAFTTVLFLVGQFLCAPVTHIFTPDLQVSALAVQAIKICTIGLIPLAFQYTLIDGFTGMGMMQWSLPLSLLRKGVYFTALFLLPAVFGATAAFFAETVSDLFPPLVTMVVYWKRRNWIIQEAASHRRLESDAQTAVQQPAALGQAQAI